MSNPRTLRSASLLALLLSAGCPYVDREAVLSVVWSQDDTEQAYVFATWEIQSGIFGVPEGASSRNHKHRIYVQAADGSGRRDLYGHRPNHGYGRIYYMNTAGYLIAGFQDGSGIRYERIRPDGTSDVVTTFTGGPGPCGTFDLIPSPTGATFAAIARLDAPPPVPSGPPPAAMPACSRGSVRVELIDATSLAVTAGPFSWTVDGLTDGTWTPGGDLIVTSSGQAWRVDPSSGPVPTAMPGCLAPRTTSSNVSAGGAEMEPGDAANPVRVARRGAPAFGCQ